MSKSHGHKSVFESLQKTLKCGLSSAVFNKINAKSSPCLRAFVVFNTTQKDWQKRLKDLSVPDKQIQQAIKTKKLIYKFIHEDDTFLLVKPLVNGRLKTSHASEMQESEYGLARDAMGPVVQLAGAGEFESLQVELSSSTAATLRGVIVGLEMASYSFKKVANGDKSVKVFVKKIKGTIAKKQIDEAVNAGKAVNLARHLVNLPPNVLHPVSYADSVKKLFTNSKNTTVTVWGEKELKKHNMGLLLGVGAGSPHPCRMVHIKYRPSGVKIKKPIAFVGKGITFDTGGANLKPSSGIRLMKKDMGGSASVAGLAYYAINSKLKQNLDFYLPLAENSLGAGSFVPGDILISASGKTVEIDNTDAEGRLILADALYVASSQTGANAPRAIIDVATLTGAIKVGLGTEIAGFFINSDKLSNKLTMACDKSGELAWRMPLYPGYRARLNSHFADMVNSASGYGGAIAAALFLQEFTNDLPWAHLDIFAWNDRAQGALNEVGGSGQMVQGLAEYLHSNP